MWRRSELRRRNGGARTTRRLGPRARHLALPEMPPRGRDVPGCDWNERRGQGAAPASAHGVRAAARSRRLGSADREPSALSVKGRPTGPRGTSGAGRAAVLRPVTHASQATSSRRFDGCRPPVPSLRGTPGDCAPLAPRSPSRSSLRRLPRSPGPRGPRPPVPASRRRPSPRRGSPGPRGRSPSSAAPDSGSTRRPARSIFNARWVGVAGGPAHPRIARGGSPADGTHSGCARSPRAVSPTRRPPSATSGSSGGE